MPLPIAKTRLVPGRRVVVTQQIAQRDETWTSRTVGQVVSHDQRKTGSWFTHSRHDRLWLDRLTVKKDDGEIIVINLDPYTHIEILPDPSPAA